MPDRDLLSDEELREIVDTEDYTLADSRGLVTEVIELRARVAELEQVEADHCITLGKLGVARGELTTAQARIAELEQHAGQSLGYVVVLKDRNGDLWCLASVVGPDNVRTAEGIGSRYATKGEVYLIAELREVSGS